MIQRRDMQIGTMTELEEKQEVEKEEEDLSVVECSIVCCCFRSSYNAVCPSTAGLILIGRDTRYMLMSLFIV